MILLWYCKDNKKWNKNEDASIHFYFSSLYNLFVIKLILYVYFWYIESTYSESIFLKPRTSTYVQRRERKSYLTK